MQVMAAEIRVTVSLARVTSMPIDAAASSSSLMASSARRFMLPSTRCHTHSASSHSTSTA